VIYEVTVDGGSVVVKTSVMVESYVVTIVFVSNMVSMLAVKTVNVDSR
jgi:hypothetical protein